MHVHSLAALAQKNIGSAVDNTVFTSAFICSIEKSSCQKDGGLKSPNEFREKQISAHDTSVINEKWRKVDEHKSKFQTKLFPFHLNCFCFCYILPLSFMMVAILCDDLNDVTMDETMDLMDRRLNPFKFKYVLHVVLESVDRWRFWSQTFLLRGKNFEEICLEIFDFVIVDPKKLGLQKWCYYI